MKQKISHLIFIILYFIVFYFVVTQSIFATTLINNKSTEDLSFYGIDMVSIKGGYFLMGSPVAEKERKNNENQHRVHVNDFKINRTEVSLKSFKQFIEDSGYKTDAENNNGGKKGCWSLSEKKWQYRDKRNYLNPGFKQNDNHPVVCISHNDSQAYIHWLNKKTALTFSLPTEAQWEYAARGGTLTSRFWGNQVDKTACSYANIADSKFSWNNNFPCNDNYQFTAPIGKYKPNPFGLNDIQGNVWEWTCSGYDKNYNGMEQKCSHVAKSYVIRGGSWGLKSYRIRNAFRSWYKPFVRGDGTGFRLVQLD